MRQELCLRMPLQRGLAAVPMFCICMPKCRDSVPHLSYTYKAAYRGQSCLFILIATFLCLRLGLSQHLLPLEFPRSEAEAFSRQSVGWASPLPLSHPLKWLHFLLGENVAIWSQHCNGQCLLSYHLANWRQRWQPTGRFLGLVLIMLPFLSLS